MKMMKKFSLLVALALVVTIGGVYATWNYASGTQVSGAESPINVDLVTYQLVGGGLAVYDGTGISLIIDDKMNGDAPGNDHIAELYFEDEMIVIFTPSSDTTKDSITSMDFNFSFELKSVVEGSQWLYNEKPIFEIKNSDPIVKQLQEITAADTNVSGHDLSGLVGKYYMVLTADEVKDIIGLNGAILLDTVSDWDAFDVARTQGNIMVTIAPASASTTP